MRPSPHACGHRRPLTSQAPAIGNHFVERGVENVYVVSGGFLGISATCPRILMGEPYEEDDLCRKLEHAGLRRPGGTSGLSSYRSMGGSVAGSARGSTAGSVRTRATGLTSLAGGSPSGRSVGAWR